MSYTLIIKKHNAGGLGDRITGIITVLSLSKIFKKEFKMFWDIPIELIFMNSNLEYNVVYNRKIISLYNTKNHEFWGKILNLCNECPFPNEDLYFYSNMTTINYLYNNPNFTLNYNNDMLNLYKNLYKDILIPREEFIEKTRRYYKDDMIGIQIRTGDFNFYDNQLLNIDKYNPIKDDNIDKYLKKLASKINARNRNIYITSDNIKVIERAKELFIDNTILYNTDSIIHIDISNNIDNRFIELFIDHYVMCNYPTELYISDFSNFGRTIALCNQTDKIYNLNGDRIIKSELLLTKKYI